MAEEGAFREPGVLSCAACVQPCNAPPVPGAFVQRVTYEYVGEGLGEFEQEEEAEAQQSRTWSPQLVGIVVFALLLLMLAVAKVCVAANGTSPAAPLGPPQADLEFVVGDQNSVDCPSGARPLNLAECRLAAAHFGRTAPVELSMSTFPPGCSAISGREKFYYNGAAVGSASASIVCAVPEEASSS